MKKKILTLTAMMLFMMTNNLVFGQDDASEWWFVRLQAGLSTINCGSNPGEVQVTFTNIDGTLATLDKPVNQYNPNTQSAAYESWGQGFEQGKADAISGENNRVNGESASNSAAFYDGYDQSRPWHEQYYVPFGNQELNVTIPSTWGTTASQNGYATIHVDGIDGVMGLSSYAYFWLKAREKAGWYFTGWSYVNGGTDLGGNVDENDSLLVKVFPGDQQGLDHITTKKIYATFQPVLVADYRVGGMINVSESNQTTVVFDASGERVSDEDFTVSVSGAHFSAAISGCTGNKVTVTVTFTNSGLAENVYRGDVTLASKSGCSELTAPVYARVSSGSATQASLYDGKTLKESGDVATLVGKIGTCTNPIISLNANYGTALATDSKWTLDLNGYNLNNTLTVNGSELTVAYSKYGGRIAGKVTVNAGKLVLNGGQIDADGAAVEVKAGASLEQNGAAITGSNYAILNSGTTVITEGAMSGNGVAGVKNTGGTLTVKGGAVEGAYAVWNAGGTASIEKGTLSGTGYGIYSDGEATTMTEKLAVVYGGTNAVYVAGGATTLNNGKFDSESEAPLHKESGTLTLVSGYFKVREIGIDLPITKEILNVSAGPEYQAGYRYFVGDSELAQLSNLGVCRIGSTAYATLEDALAYANNNPSEEVVIFMLNDYVLPAGYYTIPEKATLVVPMSDEQETPYVSINRVSKNGTTENPRRVPTEFRRLTFANGVNLNVHGTLELSGSQRASSEQHASAPDGPYGLLVMNEGSHMTLQSGSELRAWGYVIGKGETDARRGSIVREQFEMGDWKGGSESYALLSSNIFPITQYYIQNIESPVKYHPGAVLSTTTSVSVTYGGMGITASANDIKIVGVSGQDAAMFLMDIAADADNTWVRKWYDAERDVQTYEINSGAHIGSMVLNMGKVMGLDLTMNSGQFVLPITNNMKIHLLSGTMDFTQNTSLLPGAEVEVDKESTVKIAKNSDASVESGALYVYDADEWDTYAFNGKYTKVVYYSASLNKQPTARKENVKPEDAKINVHGTFDTKDGYVYTSASGANIFSTNEDAGTFVFNLNAPSESESIEVYQVKGVNNHVSTTFTPAKLKNGVGAEKPYVSTAGTPAYTTYSYIDNKWKTMLYLDCFTFDVSEWTSEGLPVIDAVYAKPQDYVKIDVTMAEIRIINNNPLKIEVESNADHTYSDANGDGRLFILLPDECQWWEVENVDNLYHCIHPNNDTYYYWDDGTTTFEDPAWKEKKFTIKWKNYDGTIIQTANSMGNLVDDYEVPYGTMAEFLGTNPTRPEDIDYTYDFAGWNPAPGRVTSDVTYTATYTKKERKYTIIFQNEGGVEIERQFLKHNDVPVCENMPTRVGYTLQWSPAIAAVTGDATYTATWLEEPPTEYKVTFYDYNGTSILQQSDVAVGAMPNYTGATPTGKATWAEERGNKEFTYVFDHWSPDIEIVSATSIKSYTAVYREVAKTYTIIFQNENGSVIESHQYAYGETPVCSEPPIKENTAQYTYTFAWTPQIQTVMEDKTYRATFTPVTNMYTVKLQSNNSAVNRFTGAGTYEYGTEITIGVTLDETKYQFDGWDNGNTAKTFTTTVEGDITLTALVTPINGAPEEYKIKFVDYNGKVLQSSNVAVGETPTPPANPNNKPATDQFTYEFDHWDPAISAVSAAQTYTAVYSEIPRQYTVIFQNENGSEIERHDYAYGATPACTNTPTKANTAQYSYTLAWEPEIHSVTGNETYRATFTPTINTYTVTLQSNNAAVCNLTGAGTYEYGTEVTIGVTLNDASYQFDGWNEDASLAQSFTTTVRNNITLTALVSSSSVVEDITLKDDEEWDVPANTEVNNFTITSNGIDLSSNVQNAENLTVNGNAIYYLNMNMKAHKWYAIAVPWKVNVHTGIYSVKGDGTTNAHLEGAGANEAFDILSFNSVAYAQGIEYPNYWEYVDENGGDGYLYPGVCYLIYFAKNHSNGIHFYKVKDAAIVNTSTKMIPAPGDNPDKAQWHAIANPAVYRANMNTGAENGDVVIYNSDDKRYEITSTNNMIIGKPFFVQKEISTETPVYATIATSGASGMPAYHRASPSAPQTNDRFVIELSQNSKIADRMIVQTIDEKANEYVIGKDLAKIGVSDIVAQMWIERYDSRLCKNTVETVDESAEYPLHIFAPTTGEYTVSAVQEKGEAALYLTYNGEAIANLSEDAYTLTLNQGTTSSYGLRVSARSPQATTAVDEVMVDNNEQVQKVLINNQLFIIRGEHIYSADGHKVR